MFYVAEQLKKYTPDKIILWIKEMFSFYFLPARFFRNN
jgi:hypothetical protein